MIPKIIHYCWFGGKEKPESVRQSISTWKNIFPDYQLIEWNEQRFDINCCRYTKEAYEAKKYAFVSDYARIQALYEQGGIYMDTDIEAVKPIDSYLNGARMLLGFEDNHYVMTGFMAAEPGMPCFGDLLERYQSKPFVLENGKFDLLPNPVIVTETMQKYGLIPNGTVQEFGDGCRIYPVDYFSAFDIAYQRLEVTENTCLIHHCMGSWQTPKDKVKPWIKSILLRIVGEKTFDRLKSRFYQ